MTAARNPVADAFAHIRGAERPDDAPPPVRTICLADVEAKSVAWLWRHRLALGTLNALEGPQSGGKTTVICDLIARVTTGAAWPDEPVGATRPPRDVLIVGPEDNAARVLVPRLTTAGADRRRVHVVERERTPDNPYGALFLPADLPLIAHAIEAHRPAWLHFDAINDLLVGVRINDDAEVRGALSPLLKLAEDHDVCVTLTRHFGKGGNRHAMNAGLGSVAFTGVPRVVLQLYPERLRGGPDGAGGAPAAPPRLLAVAKCNLAPLAATLRFTLETTDDGAGDAPPRVRWDGADARTADDLQAEYRADDGGDDPDTRAAQSEAATWLEAALADGPRGASEVKAAAKADGFAERTLERAARRRGVVFKRLGFGGGSVWHLPGADAAATILAPARDPGDEGVRAPESPTPADSSPDLFADGAARPARSRRSRRSRPRTTTVGAGADEGAGGDAGGRVARSRRAGHRDGNGGNGGNGADAAATRARVLDVLTKHPDTRRTLGEVAARAGLRLADARRAVEELAAAHLAHATRDGVRAAPHPAAA